MDSFGRKFRVTVFGESHGEEIGVVLDGVPAGLDICEGDFAEDIARRKSGARGTTPRIEEDRPRIVSGVFEGHTTGAPLTILFANEDVRSADYSLFTAMPRPGHADMTAALKWDDCQDPRGGGHFSGRLTLPVVAAGVVAKKVLEDATILDESSVVPGSIRAEIVELGGIALAGTDAASLAGTDDAVLVGADAASLVEADDVPDIQSIGSGADYQHDRRLLPEWEKALENAMQSGDSLGAVVECRTSGLAPGYGEPFWDSVESVIAHAVFSIPGVRGIEFGDGFGASRMKGSQHNDPYGPDGIPVKNGAGGVNGGISNGAPVVFRVAFKPTSSIRMAQPTWNFSEDAPGTLEIPGRHDVCFALRTPVIVEAMTAIALADLVLLNR